jgi:hypothetical protein
MITQSNDKNAKQQCSAFGTGAGSTDFCSVVIGTAQNPVAPPTNAQCTVMFASGATTQGTRQCSAFDGANPNSQCSAMINGTFSGPDSNGHCGSKTYQGGPEY